MLIVCSAIWIVSHLSTRLLYNTRFFQLSHRFSIMSASNNIVFYFLNSSSSLDVYYTVDIWHKIQSTWEPKKRPSLPFLGHWPVLHKRLKERIKNWWASDGRFRLPPLDKLWLVGRSSGHQIGEDLDGGKTWIVQRFFIQNFYLPECHLKPRWFAWETDMWSEECSRREGTVFGDIFLRKFRLRPKKIVFGDNFTQILPAVTTKHLPDRRTPAAFYFQQDYFFFEYLQADALTYVPLKSFAWLPVNEICSSVLMYANLVSPQPTKHTLPV